jgi:hypothetical protein
MACFQNWFEKWSEDSDEYVEKKNELERDYNKLKRIIEFYYQANEIDLPSVVGFAPRLKLKNSEKWNIPEINDEVDLMVSPHTVRWETNKTPPEKEPSVINQITLHVLCDGIGWTHLYDIYSIIEVSDTDSKFKRVTDLVSVCLRNFTNEPIYGKLYPHCHPIR